MRKARQDSLREIPLFREDPEDEFSFLVGLVGGGHDDVLAGRQAEALGHLSHVDVGFAPGPGGVVQEEIFLQVLLVPVHLGTEEPTGPEALGGLPHPAHSPFQLSLPKFWAETDPPTASPKVSASSASPELPVSLPLLSAEIPK